MTFQSGRRSPGIQQPLHSIDLRRPCRSAGKRPEPQVRCLPESNPGWCTV